MSGIISIKCNIQTGFPVDIINEDIKAWLEEKAKAHNLCWLLANAYDGVIWGELKQDRLHISNDLFGPELRSITLQSARLFGENNELLIWRANEGWQARLIKDCEGLDIECYEEHHLLWGTNIEQRKNGFALLRHGSEGRRHAPPVKEDVELPLALKIRHYINYDEDGQAYVQFSRMVSISKFKREEK